MARHAYVQRIDGTGLRVQVTTTGGSHPRWPKGGNELFYFSAKDELMAVEIAFDGENIDVGKPQLLFVTPNVRGGDPRSLVWEFFDVSPDGQRFLVVVPVAEPVPRPITVLLNRAPELFD